MQRYRYGPRSPWAGYNFRHVKIPTCLYKQIRALIKANTPTPTTKTLERLAFLCRQKRLAKRRMKEYRKRLKKLKTT